MKTLGQKIRELRQERDLSLRELASKIRVSAAFMSDVELDRRHPSDKHLVSLAHALNTSLNDLRQFDTRPPLQEFRKRTHSDPAYGLALRRMMDSDISSEELLEFIERRQRQSQGDNK